jgi:hypothetical protein
MLSIGLVCFQLLCVLQERVSLAAGGYVGVRRVVRLLEHGDNAKRIVDAVIDANAQMLNLRVAIMRCVLVSVLTACRIGASGGAAHVQSMCMVAAK